MFRIALRSLAFVLALLLAGCGWLNFSTSEDETVTWSAQRLYTEAKEAMADGDYARAIRYFERLEARYPFGRYAQQAQLEIAYAYYRENDPAQAVAACDRFIKLHPNHPSVDYAYYLKGIVNFYEDQNLLAQFADQDASERDPRSARDSFAAFKDLATRFPDSKYTPDAIARMNFLVNALASHEVHVSRYYMRRGAYLAAANRAQYTVKTYPDAPAVEEALYIMVQAYERMGMKDLRDDSERVLVKNFPNSPWLSGTHARADKSWWQIWK
ncbi:MAG TPA: outer membrane protein assembly factor BamD [Burkholderiales bacterium]|jgi:outer membrane protein assembly factor BamD|nr:outer membrane protein assembly factor BamD [Burkholderiales bacterium]